MRRSLNIMDIEDMYLNIMKAVCDKPTADIILTGDRLKTFPLDIQVAILYVKRCSRKLHSLRGTEHLACTLAGF